MGTRILIKFLFFFALFAYISFQTVSAATLSKVTDTLTNSRLSFRAPLNSAVANGQTAIAISGAASADPDVQNLFQRDNVCFTNSAFNGCEGSFAANNGIYTVGSVSNQSGTSFALAQALAVALPAADIVISTQSATHTVTFITANTMVNPTFKVRIPAATQTAASNDGIPDFSTVSSSSGFDAAGLTHTTDITCSTGTAGFKNSTATGGNYHEATCAVTGTTNSGATITITIGGTHKLINPAPTTSAHTRGNADIYQVTVLETDGAATDTGYTSIAPVEGVLVSANVNTAFTFQISAVASGSTKCGVTTTVTTTATTVPFGNVTTGIFYHAAHVLTVTTSADSWVVTAQENNPLSIDGLNGLTLADTTCPSNSCTTTSSADWTSNASSGFGYSLNGSDAAFTYNESSRSFSARPFDTSTPRTVMSKSAAVASSAIDVCYRLAVGLTQQPGYYLNKLTYIATPTF